MLKVQSNNGEVDIYKMDGTEDVLIADLGAAVHKVMLIMANSGAKSKEDAFFKYGLYARRLVGYIDTTVKRIEEIEEEK